METYLDELAFTTGGDGTTNKNQNFESLHFNMQVGDEQTASSSLPGSSVHRVRFGEVRLSANHRSDTQMRGDTHYIEEIVSLYNRSPLGLQVAAQAEGTYTPDISTRSLSKDSGEPMSVSSLADRKSVV